MNRQIFTFLTLAITFTLPKTGSSFCGDDKEADITGLPSMSFNEAVARIKNDHGVTVTTTGSSKCSNGYYKLTDSDGSSLGFVHINSSNAAALWKKAETMLKVPKAQLKSLMAAQNTFWADETSLEKELGVNFSDPSALSEEVRFPGKKVQMFYVTAPLCEKEEGYRSSAALGTINVNTTLYIDGRTDYSPETIYQKGDIRKAFLNNADLLEKMRVRAENNVKYCDKYQQKTYDLPGVSQRLSDLAGKHNSSSIRINDTPVEKPNNNTLINGDEAKPETPTTRRAK